MALKHILIRSTNADYHEAFEIEDTGEEYLAYTWRGTLGSFEVHVKRAYKHRKTLTIKHETIQKQENQQNYLVEGEGTQKNGVRKERCWFGNTFRATSEEDARTQALNFYQGAKFSNVVIKSITQEG